MAGQSKRRANVIGYVGTGKRLHELGVGLDSHVTMLQSPEFGEVVDKSSVADPVVIVTLMEGNIFFAPGSIKVGTKEPTKLDNVKDDDSVDDQDDKDQDELFSPSHA